MARQRQWEQAVIGELSRSLRPGDIFFDLGAFIGAFTLLASRLVAPEGRVVAFEPDPGPRATLERNLSVNRATNVTIAPYVVGDREGTVRFSMRGDSASHVSDAGEVEARQVTLDGYCAELGVRPTIMKVDIEGAEGKALGGSEVARGLRELVVEIHEPVLREQGIEPVALLDGLGPYELLESPEQGNYGVVVRPATSTNSASC
jgi:FkbM family methyltransferase